jgi:hypothetical protein
VATTVYAQRCNELKNRYTTNSKSKEPSFVTQYNSLWHLANLGRLSRHNVIWLGKRIHEMVEAWGTTEENQREMLDRLHERQARAWKRWEARIAEKAAKKAAVATKGRSRKKDQQPTTPAPSPDIWSL